MIYSIIKIGNNPAFFVWAIQAADHTEYNQFSDTINSSSGSIAKLAMRGRTNVFIFDSISDCIGGISYR